MNKTCVCIYVLTLIIGNCFCQKAAYNKHPKDTISKDYYSNGQIRRVRIEDYVKYGENDLINRFYNIVCDTAAQKQELRLEKKSTNSFSTDRIFYKDSLVVVRTFGIDGGMLSDTSTYSIFLETKTDKRIRIFFRFRDKDSLITNFSVSRADTLRYSAGNKTYFNADFIDGASFKNTLQLDLGDKDNLYLKFYNKHYLKQIIYRWVDDKIESKNNTFITTVYFDYKNRVKSYGHYNPPDGRQGVWYEYHKEKLDTLILSSLKSEGSYSGSEFIKGREYNKRKTGVWKYYSEDNCLIKKETWDNGQLLKTEEFGNGSDK